MPVGAERHTDHRAGVAWLGHPLHPLLTDLPIGAWSMAALLDALDARSADVLVAPASRPRSRPRLQGSTTGRTPTVKQPAWGSCTPPPTTALGLQVASLVAHSRDHRGRGKALSLVMRSLVCRRLPRRTPHLRQGRQRQPHRLARGTRRVDTSVRRGGSGRRHAPEGRRCGGADPAYRRGDAVQAIDATCTHMGGPLADGKFATTA